VNEEVNAWFDVGPLRRVLAQVEVGFSSSMIEAWWRSLKHGRLYLHQLDTFAALEKLIAFYVEQHNTMVPHAAFAGQTPDEMYFGRGDHVPGELAAGHARARAARLKSNRELACGVCRPPVQDAPGLSALSANSRMLHLQDEMSGMSRVAAGLRIRSGAGSAGSRQARSRCRRAILAAHSPFHSGPALRGLTSAVRGSCHPQGIRAKNATDAATIRSPMATPA
jgi:hypothetical protein